MHAVVATIEKSVGITAPSDFDDFYRQEHRGVLALAAALTGRWDVAEELTQEAFLAAHRRWSEVGNYEHPGAWVRRVVANLAVSRTRRWAAEVRALARLHGLRGKAVVLPDDGALFWSAVRHLPQRQAQVVALHYLEDRSVEDIGDILACAPNTVKVHLHRARRTLAERLGTPLEEE
jgi:RNA polymerase sigma-70 factor (ECF subfamily)